MMRRFVVLPGASIVMLGALVLGCRDESVTPPAVPAGPSVASCTSLLYGGNSYSVQCSAPGQSQQPSGVNIFPAAIAPVCFKVTCSSGCASSVTKGTATGTFNAPGQLVCS